MFPYAKRTATIHPFTYARHENRTPVYEIESQFICRALGQVTKLHKKIWIIIYLNAIWFWWPCFYKNPKLPEQFNHELTHGLQFAVPTSPRTYTLRDAKSKDTPENLLLLLTKPFASLWGLLVYLVTNRLYIEFIKTVLQILFSSKRCL